MPSFLPLFALVVHRLLAILMMSALHAFRVANVLIWLPLLALGDTIFLKDGKQYTGVFLSGSTVRVRFKTTSGAIRTFPARDVDHIQFGKEPTVGEEHRQATPAAMPAATPRATTGQVAAPATSAPTPAPAPAPTVTPAPPVETVPPSALGYPQSRTSPLDDTGSIDSAYTALRAETGVLGPPQSTAQATADGRAEVRYFTNGAIYFTSQGGAHAIYGPIRAAWMASGGERSKLGYPTSDEQDSNGGYNRMQNFERGSITWDQQNGAQIQYNGNPQ